MDPHVHISAIHLLASMAFAIVVFGTMHLLSLSNDSRFSRALLALGF